MGKWNVRSILGEAGGHEGRRTIAEQGRSGPLRRAVQACVERMEGRTLLSAGELDTTFGSGGLVTTDFGFGRDQGTAVVVQPDGKVVAGGSAYGSGTSGNSVLARFNADGSLDQAFGTGGKISTDVQSDTFEYISGLALQPDGKLVAAGTHSAGSGAGYDFVVARYHSDGTPDTSFGAGGKVVTNFGTSNDAAAAVLIQPDGKIVAAGTVGSSNSMFALARFNANGTLDTSFDIDGKVTTDFTSSFDQARGLTLQADGKIVAAGHASNSALDGGLNFALARYEAHGTLDRSFDGDGKLTTDFSQGSDDAYGVLVQPDGHLVAVGYTQFRLPNTAFGQGRDVALARYRSDGSLDGTFGGGDGRVTTDFAGAHDIATSVALQPDGRVVVAGQAGTSGGFTPALARYEGNGDLDLTFGSAGKVVTPVEPAAIFHAISLQPDGKVVAAGTLAADSRFDLAVARYSVAGVPDVSFGTGGIATVDFATGSDTGMAMELQPDGKIVVVGQADMSASRGGGFAAARYLADGTLDPSFGGGDGRVTTRIPNTSDSARAVAVQSDGKLVVAGGAFTVVRYHEDGSLDTSFDGDGILRRGGGDARALALQPDGRIIVAGSIANDFALLRFNSNGSLDTTFGGDGYVITPRFGGYYSDSAYTVAVRPDGKIVIAGAGSLDFALLRYNADGSPDTSFDSDGKVTSGIGGVAFDLALQPDGKVVAAGVDLIPSPYIGEAGYRFGLVRHNDDGSLDASFDADGRVTSTFAGTAFAVAVQSDGKILAAGDSAGNGSSTTPRHFRVARFNIDGSPDFDFGTGGVITTTFGPGGTSDARAVAVQPDGKIVAAGQARNLPTGYDFALARYHGSGNTAPSADAGGPYAVAEGGTSSLSGTGADAEGGVLSYAWDLDGDGAFDDATGPAPTFSAAGRDGPIDVAVALRVTDPGGLSATGASTVTIRNAAPVVAGAAAGQVASEGAATAIDLGSFSDAALSDGPWPVTVDWGDGSPVANLLATAAGSLGTLAHTFTDNGTYSVRLTVKDKDGGIGFATSTVTVDNVAPAPALAGLPPATVPEGTPIALTGSATDAGIRDTAVGIALSWTVTKNDSVFASDSGPDVAFTPDDDGVYVVSLTASDKDGAAASTTTEVEVSNVVPSARIVGPAAGSVYAVGQPIPLAGTYADPGAADSHSAVWTLTSATSGQFATPDAPAAGGVASAEMVVPAAGVYRVSLSVRDDDGGEGRASTLAGGGEDAYVVVYDPAAGSVTGGGWIDSPAGAYAADPTLAGRASFGFVSQYKKGATAPSGQTQFQFKAGGLNFHSDSYEWLVVSGARAQYKGVGSVNGVGGYRFMLTAVDGQQPGGGGVDKFRIRIWDANGGIVYDNNMGAHQDADPNTALGGGSILIHTK